MTRNVAEVRPEEPRKLQESDSPWEDVFGTYICSTREKFADFLPQTCQDNQESVYAGKMQLMGTLATSIAHDFRNVVSVIQGGFNLQQLGLEQENASLVSTGIKIARQASLCAKGLVDNLLSYAKNESLKTDFLDVGSVLNDSISLFKVGIKLGSKHYIFDLVQSAERKITLINSAHLIQVVLNLCVNAAQSIESPEFQGSLGSLGSPELLECQEFKGKIIVKIENETISSEGCRTLKPSEYIKISVEDNGQGIAEEIIERIFEPCFSTKEGVVNGGLGWA